MKPECDQPWQANSHTTLGPMGPLSDTENFSPATEMVSSQLCTRPIHSALPSRSRGRTAAQRGKLARHDSTANAGRFSYKQLRTRRQCPNRRIGHFATRGQNGDHMPLADSDMTMRPTGPRTGMVYSSQLRKKSHPSYGRAAMVPPPVPWPATHAMLTSLPAIPPVSR